MSIGDEGLQWTKLAGRCREGEIGKAFEKGTQADTPLQPGQFFI
jgi:hypothetical protein